MALSCCEKLSALLKRIVSNHKGEIYCTICFYSFITKNKLK